MAVQQDEQRQLEGSRQELRRQYAGRVAEREVDKHFRASVRTFEGAKVRTFVPVLAAKVTRERLRQLAP